MIIFDLSKRFWDTSQRHKNIVSNLAHHSVLVSDSQFQLQCLTGLIRHSKQLTSRVAFLVQPKERIFIIFLVLSVTSVDSFKL